MGEVLLGSVVVVGLLVTPIVGVTCGMIAQARYKRRLEGLPEKVVATLPKRFPMADLLICLFMLGPILGDLALASAGPFIGFTPTPTKLMVWCSFLLILLAVNYSGPYLIRIGMPPDGSFGSVPKPVDIQFLGKPAVALPAMFDAREI